MAIVQEIVTQPAVRKTVDKIVCDECGAHAWTKCTECRADICAKHTFVHPENLGGDSTDYICESCRSVFNYYSSDLFDLEEKIDAIKDARNEECRRKRKKRNEANKT